MWKKHSQERVRSPDPWLPSAERPSKQLLRLEVHRIVDPTSPLPAPGLPDLARFTERRSRDSHHVPGNSMLVQRAPGWQCREAGYACADPGQVSGIQLRLFLPVSVHRRDRHAHAGASDHVHQHLRPRSELRDETLKLVSLSSHAATRGYDASHRE